MSIKALLRTAVELADALRCEASIAVEEDEKLLMHAAAGTLDELVRELGRRVPTDEVAHDA